MKEIRGDILDKLNKCQVCDGLGHCKECRKLNQILLGEAIDTFGDNGTWNDEPYGELPYEDFGREVETLIPESGNSWSQ